MIGLGLILTKVVFDGTSGWDVEVNRWFADRRTATWNDLTSYGSHVAETITVIGVAAVVVLVLGLFRYWREIGFLVIALVLEVTVFLTTTLFVDRARPPVVRLDDAPPTSSFPSGHTAAAVVLYVGLALIVTARVRNPRARDRVDRRDRRAAVRRDVSRLYRGMHFPTDVASGALLGVCVSCRRAVRGAHRRRRRAPPGGDRHDLRRGHRAPGKSLGGGLGELREVLARARRRRPALVRGAEEQEGAEAGARVRSTDGADLVFVWGGDGMVQRCIDALAGTEATHRDRAGRHREPARDQPRHPEGHRRGRARSACTAPRRKLDVGVINGERFAVMAGAGFDARMIRDADGALKDRVGPPRLHLDRRQEPARRPRCARASASTASKWFDGKASCVLVGNVGTIIGGIDGVRATPSPTTAGSRSASSPPKGLLQWTRALGRTALGQRREVAVRAHDERRRRIDVRLDEADAVRARRRRPQEDEAPEDPRRARRDHRLRPGDGGADEHRDAGPRDLGAHRRRRPARRCVTPAAGSCSRDAFMRLRVADGFSHARSLAFVIVARARAGDHRPRRPRGRARQRPARATSSCDRCRPPCPGPAGELLTARGRPGAQRRRVAPLPGARRSGSSARSSRAPR